MQAYRTENSYRSAARLSPAELRAAMASGEILQATALAFDTRRQLRFELGGVKAVMPFAQCADGAETGTVRDIAVLTRVGRPTCFVIEGLDTDEDGAPCYRLSRAEAQRLCKAEYLDTLSPGDILPCTVTHIEPFGAFCDVGCGISALLPIDCMSVSRISSPADRVSVGQQILCAIKNRDAQGRFVLTIRELLGTWAENAARFTVGETVVGIVRSVEEYGTFVEIAPNLAGLAESCSGLAPGEEVYKLIPVEELYARTGIQKAIYNTIYQLMAVKTKHPEYLEQAETLLHVPDYFHFLLTGQKTCEYTEATTGQMVNAQTKDWDYEIIDKLGYPRRIFQKLIMPGTSVGHLTEELQKEVGFDVEVVAPATHDTGSAVLAVPANDDDFIYISSGTWSLMGIERKTPDCSPKSCELNFTNEGGYAGRFRYIKNIMGLWMIQSVRHEVNDKYSFAEICAMAEEAKDFPSRVDANDECFLSPENMTEEVKDYCRRTGQQVPETMGEIATVIYTSLAECYAKAAKELEELTGRTYSRIHVVGGGSNAGYLNELTAKATGKEVHAGPGEATAIGNITAQMIKEGEFKSVEEARTTIHESFGIKIFKA